MKKYFFLILFFCALSGVAQTTEKFKQLYWLIGEWDRTNVKPGRSGVEKWVANSATELHGWGISMKGADTSLIEKTKLIIKNNNIYYVADVPGNKEPVYFKLTSITDNAFTCENPEHDFPKKITYIKEGEVLKATISGNGKSIDYLFLRKP